MPSSTKHDVLGKLLSASNGTRWRMTKFQGRRVAMSSDRGHGSRYFRCTNPKTGTSAAALVALKSDPQLYRTQSTLTSVAGKGKRQRFLAKKNIDYLAVPKVLGIGTIALPRPGYRFVILDMYDLNDYHALSSSTTALRSSMPTVFKTCLYALEFLHSNSYVHGRVTPQAIWLKYGRRGAVQRVTLVDYSNSSSITSMSIKEQEYWNRGYDEDDPSDYWSKFTSVHRHLGSNPSPCGDVESLCYSLIHARYGSLPWSKASTMGVTRSVKLTYRRHPNKWNKWMAQRSSVDKWILVVLLEVYRMNRLDPVDYDVLLGKGGPRISKQRREADAIPQSDSDEDEDEEDAENVDVDAEYVFGRHRDDTQAIIPKFESHGSTSAQVVSHPRRLVAKASHLGPATALLNIPVRRKRSRHNTAIPVDIAARHVSLHPSLIGGREKRRKRVSFNLADNVYVEPPLDMALLQSVLKTSARRIGLNI